MKPRVGLGLQLEHEHHHRPCRPPRPRRLIPLPLPLPPCLFSRPSHPLTRPESRRLRTPSVHRHQPPERPRVCHQLVTSPRPLQLGSPAIGRRRAMEGASHQQRTYQSVSLPNFLLPHLIAADSCHVILHIPSPTLHPRILCRRPNRRSPPPRGRQL